ncbi:LRR receptor-like serine threonine-protein kinase [Seminavis robusta]|uniref:non-specific serine/threonine protein kinase n=1 Tax=Seminavis robusta TaxID=568900 RepID=A0A9N8H2C1_9STRA|nr:LRR receptor-like serine threonine-protein kinase [Seminavis robusta]|eukprot:Sro16_g011830.1 LRR receptor-like serine threonine-protein kinase (1252) ;mRNA; f:134011-137842
MSSINRDNKAPANEAEAQKQNGTNSPAVAVGDGALDELEIIKIAEARTKAESLPLLSEANQKIVATNTTTSDRASSGPAASTLRGQRDRPDPPRPHQRTGTTSPADTDNGLEDDSNSAELFKILEAREQALARQQQHTDTSGNNQENRVAMSMIVAARDQQISTLGQNENTTGALDELDSIKIAEAPAKAESPALLSEVNQQVATGTTNGKGASPSRPTVLRFLRKRAPAVNQEERLEEGNITDVLCNENVGQAATNLNPVIDESQPGAYSGAPGLPPQRNPTPRFSQLGIVGTTPIFSPSLEMEISQEESTEFQSTNMPDSHSGLMVANLVADLRHENLQLAEELQSTHENDIEEQRVERSKRAMLSALKWLLLGVVLIVAVVLAVVLGTRNKSATIAQEAVSSAPTTSVMPSVSPSSMPTKTLLSARYDIKGLSESTAESIGKPGSPQQQAYDWTFQHPKFDEMPNWRKLQLFALGTFYFSFENWPDYYQWMDYSNTECSWTTDLDSPEGSGSTSSGRPPGYRVGFWCSFSSSCCLPSLPYPFDSNCNDEGHFYYMKLRLSTWDAPPISGTLPPEVFLLTGITIFDVRDAGLTGSIPSEIGMLSLMTDLNFASNQITGQIPSEIGFLTDLDYLNLGGNAISGSVPTSIGQTNLTRLLLEYNELSGSLPSELGLLSFLQRMDLAFNQITGPLSSELGSFKSIRRLDARNNNISGLPTELGLMTDLVYLMLRDNAIAGTLPSEIGNLSNMEYLSLERNLINGAFPSTFNHSSARQFDLQDNRLTDIPTEIGNLGDDIEQLDLSNNMIATLPSELFLLTSLFLLRLDRNQIEHLPKEVEQMTNLDPCGGGWDAPDRYWLTLNGNKLASVPTEIGSLTNLRSWNMDGNSISSFPGFEWSNLTHLQSIRLSHNMLNSTIPSELGLLIDLAELDLSSNVLVGSIPSELGGIVGSVSRWNETLGEYVPQEVPRVKILNLGNNLLSGWLPSELGLLTELRTLDLSHNLLSFSVLSEVGLLQQLIELDLSSNGLIGSIPSEIGNVENSSSCWRTSLFFGAYESDCAMLLLLDLHNNSLTGSLSTEMARLTGLEVLDISFNKISGPIPSEFGQLMTTLTKYNATLDVIYVDEKETPLIQTLDLSNNQLSGWLPSELGLLTSLETLDLSVNSLTGSIPSELGNLNASVSRIMLWGNNFSGTLPQSLCPWYCTRQQCSVTEYASDTNGSVMVAGDCGTMAGWVEVDCSDESLLDCIVCDCW